MKKRILTVAAFVLLSASAIAQRTMDIQGDFGHYIEYKKSLKRADVTLDEKFRWIIIDDTKYIILKYEHTQDVSNDYYKLHTITEGSATYLIVWDVKHKNILIQKAT